MQIRDKRIVVWFSCGAASAVAAERTLALYGDDNEVRIVNNPIKDEDDDNVRFLKDVEKWLGVEIEFAINPKYPDQSCVEVWEDRRFMSGPAGAPCTYQLKKRARQLWEVENPHDFLVLGFTADEVKRHERFRLNERDNILPILIDEGITKQDCFRVINEAGIQLPGMYHKGYPNANCPGCVKSTSPTYWNLTRKQHPEVWKSRCEQSRRLGARLVRYKGKRIFLDELPEDAVGRPIKGMNFECGIFCDTGDHEH